MALNPASETLLEVACAAGGDISIGISTADNTGCDLRLLLDDIIDNPRKFDIKLVDLVVDQSTLRKLLSQDISGSVSDYRGVPIRLTMEIWAGAMELTFRAPWNDANTQA
jgi:hypothetical protein